MKGVARDGLEQLRDVLLLEFSEPQIHVLLTEGEPTCLLKVWQPQTFSFATNFPLKFAYNNSSHK